MAIFDPYKILGVKRSAKAEQIKAAYRDLAKMHHPDVEGGNEEKFKDISRAHELLMDEEARRNYDAFGLVEGDPQAQMRKQAILILQQMFIATLNKILVDNLDSVDLIAHLRESVRDTQRRTQQQLAEVIAQRDKNKLAMEKVQARLKAKRKVPNIFIEALEKIMETQQVPIDQLQQQVDIGNIMLDILTNFSYDFERPYQAVPMIGSWVPMSRTAATTSAGF